MCKGRRRYKVCKRLYQCPWRAGTQVQLGNTYRVQYGCITKIALQEEMSVLCGAASLYNAEETKGGPRGDQLSPSMVGVFVDIVSVEPHCHSTRNIWCLCQPTGICVSVSTHMCMVKGKCMHSCMHGQRVSLVDLHG
jgi:hypothetical protein